MRYLLSPKTPFEWIPALNTLFERSKEIIEGVRLFDPKLPTCLDTDFSGKDIGFLLLQKTCTCLHIQTPHMLSSMLEGVSGGEQILE